MSWRDKIVIHPAAEIFPLLDKAELRELADDIKANGLHEKIKIIERPRRQPDAGTSNLGDFERVVLDGRNRLDAMELAGLPIFSHGATELNLDIFEAVPDETDPVSYVIGINIKRRHLTGEQKRELIAKLLKANPERSDRATAELVKVDHKTIGAVRRDLEGTGEIPQLNARTGKDGKERHAEKKPRARAVTVEDDRADRIKQTVRRFCEPVHELHGRLSDLNADSAAVELLLARQKKDKIFRQRVADLVSGLTDLLARIDALAKREKSTTAVGHEQAPPTAPDQPADAAERAARRLEEKSSILDIPACLDRRPKAPLAAADNKAKAGIA